MHRTRLAVGPRLVVGLSLIGLLTFGPLVPSARAEMSASNPVSTGIMAHPTPTGRPPTATPPKPTPLVVSPTPTSTQSAGPALASGSIGSPATTVSAESIRPVGQAGATAPVSRQSAAAVASTPAIVASGSVPSGSVIANLVVPSALETRTPARPPGTPAEQLAEQSASIALTIDVASTPAVVPSPLPTATPDLAARPPSTEPLPGAGPAPEVRAAAPLADILAGWGVHWSPEGGLQARSPGVTPTASPTQPGVDTIAAGPPAPLATGAEEFRRASVSEIGAWTDASVVWLRVPFRTQIDGTTYAQVNCGPASLAMVLAGFGIDVAPGPLREYVNQRSGDYSAEDGTSLYVLAGVAAEAGLRTFGVGDRWSVEAVREHVRAGHPVITLTKYRSLPGHGRSAAEFDHYIVITGLADDDLIYNDAAFVDDYGYNLLISQADLEHAWSFSSNPRHAVAIGLGNAPIQTGFAPRLRALLPARTPESPSSTESAPADDQALVASDETAPASAGLMSEASSPDVVESIAAPDELLDDQTDRRPVLAGEARAREAEVGGDHAPLIPASPDGTSPPLEVGTTQSLDTADLTAADGARGPAWPSTSPMPTSGESTLQLGAILVLLLVHGGTSRRVASTRRHVGPPAGR